MRGPFVGVLITRIIVYWGLFWGSPILENSHMSVSTNLGGPSMGLYNKNTANAHLYGALRSQTAGSMWLFLYIMYRTPKDHLNIRILHTRVSGIPLILGLGTKM